MLRQAFKETSECKLVDDYTMHVILLIKFDPPTNENFDESIDLLDRLEDKHKENYSRNTENPKELAYA